MLLRRASPSSLSAAHTQITKRFYARQTRDSFIASFAPDGGNPHTSFPTATVFGCTGFIGRYVTQELAYNGYQVIVPFRGSEFKIQDHKVMGDIGQIVPMRFALNKPNTIYDICARSNVVINCIGRNHSKYFDDDIVTSNVHVPELISKACAETGVDRLVHMSMLHASETSPSQIQQLKAQSEARVREHSPQATVLRLANTYGLGDRFMYHFARRLQAQHYYGVPLVKQGQGKVQPVFVGNVADAVVAVLKQGKDSEGKTYNLAGPKQYKINELVKFMADTIPMQYNATSWPLPIAMMIAYANELRSNRPCFTRDFVTRSCYDQVIDGKHGDETLTFADLGLDPVSVEEVMPVLLRKWQKHTGFIIKDTYHMPAAN